MGNKNWLDERLLRGMLGTKMDVRIQAHIMTISTVYQELLSEKARMSQIAQYYRRSVREERREMSCAIL